MRSAISCLSMALLLLFCGSTARANPLPTSVLFDDSTDNLVVTAYYGATPVSIPAGGESFSMNLLQLGLIQPHFTNVDIYDASGTLSDTIRLNGDVFSFQSDGPGVSLTPSSSATKIWESGGIQDAGPLTSWGGSVEIKFRSDVEGMSEPSTWIPLFGMAALAVGLARCRRVA